MSPENNRKVVSFNTRHYTSVHVHVFCFLKLFPIVCIGLSVELYVHERIVFTFSRKSSPDNPTFRQLCYTDRVCIVEWYHPRRYM